MNKCFYRENYIPTNDSSEMSGKWSKNSDHVINDLLVNMTLKLFCQETIFFWLFETNTCVYKK